MCLVYHICHVDVECEDFKNFLAGGKVKFVTVDFTNDRRVLSQIGLVVGQPFDLQKNGLVPSHQLSVLTLAGAMVDPSYGKLTKPSPKFHRAWQWNVLEGNIPKF